MTGRSEELLYVSVLVTGLFPSYGQLTKPRSALPVAVICAETAAGTSTRPAPTSYDVPSICLDVLIRPSLSCCPVQSGCFWASSAATPATCGVAIDVPLIDVYGPLPVTS